VQRAIARTRGIPSGVTVINTGKTAISAATLIMASANLVAIEAIRSPDHGSGLLMLFIA